MVTIVMTNGKGEVHPLPPRGPSGFHVAKPEPGRQSHPWWPTGDDRFADKPTG